MGDYLLSGLNPREFEHLVQALAKRVIAPGVRPFGDGKDGGREATFDGPMAYPSSAAPWDGYLVIQAKFLQRPFREDDEGEWALGNLKKEMVKFADPTKGLKKPDYYLFVTNAVFTPVKDSGTIDRADVLMKEYADKSWLKGYAIWHHDDVCRFLDAEEGIRARYSSLITPGDVLARVMGRLEEVRADFESVMANFLQKQLQQDQFVKLGQAGYATAERTPLAQVFVDLAASEEPSSDPHPSEPPILMDGVVENPTIGFVGMAIGEASQFLDPRTLREREEERVKLDPITVPPSPMTTRPGPGRYVLVGGPGQGKTTVGQYICQIYRAAILDERPPESLGPKALQAIEDLKRQCGRDGVGLPSVRRYPIRVVLSQFADSLAKESVSSFLGYIRAMINRVTDREISFEDLRVWLGEYPWIVVLDGLDEVPATSNREEVLDAVEAFWSDVAECNADVMAVATTRPQGYEKEFSPQHYRHLHLIPFSPNRSMSYARRLVESRYHDDPDGLKRILDGLKRACQQPATARLMRTPLQVTIMAMLVDLYGDPPDQRWQLFQRYFEVIYERELGKGGDISTILREQRLNVVAIHQRVGLRLQEDSERAGASEALLARSSFESVVRERLAEVGYEGERLAAITSRIAEVAMDRLVFLVSPVDEKIGFEIRSLQEFMAAEALMSGDDEAISRNLKSLASSMYWRNVVLFMAGHCVARRPYAFDSLIALCHELNEVIPFGASILEGSYLALDILEDGLTRENPSRYRSLARLVLRLLDQPPDTWIHRLVGLLTPDSEVVFREEMLKRIVHADVLSQLSTWALMDELRTCGSDMARSLLDAWGPLTPSDELEVLRATAKSPHRDIPAERLLPIVPSIPYHELIESEIYFVDDSRDRNRYPGWFNAADGLYNRSRNRESDREFEISIECGLSSRLSLKIIPAQPDPQAPFAALAQMPSGHEAWNPIRASAEFVASPSPKTLGDALRAIAAVWDQKAFIVTIPTGHLPWPLASCIGPGLRGEHFQRLALKAEAGDLGDLTAWEAAERKWSVSGLNMAAIQSIEDSEWPYDRRSLERSFPFRNAASHFHGENLSDADIKILSEINRTSRGSMVGSELADMTLDLLSNAAWTNGVHQLPALDDLHAIAINSRKRIVNLSIFHDLSLRDVVSAGWLDLLDFLGREFHLYSFHRTRSHLPEVISSLIAMHPDREGLTVLLGTLALYGSKGPASVQIDKQSFDKSTEKTSMFLLFTRLAQPLESERDAEELAIIASNLMSDGSHVINRICDVIFEHHKHNRFAALLLERLLAMWPKARWLYKRRAIGFIAEAVRVAAETRIVIGQGRDGL